MKLTRRRQTWKRTGAVLLATLLTFGSLPEYDFVVGLMAGLATVCGNRMKSSTTAQ